MWKSKSAMLLAVVLASSAAIAGSNINSASVVAPIDNRNTNSNANTNLITNTNANTNANTNLNSNTNAQGQLQGQIQGQGQKQNSVNINSTNSSARSNSSSDNYNTISINHAAQERDPVSSANAAALTTSNGTCMGSSSAGAQGVSFGVSVGSTWVDEGCDARYDAAALSAIGMHKAALARLCQKSEIADAIKTSGAECPGVKKAVISSAAPVQKNDGPNCADPFIAARAPECKR
jgi:hypothetical protein